MNIPRLSPLALMHPVGIADEVLILGSHCPPRLCATPRRDDVATQVALAVIAPSLAECQQRGWLDYAIAQAGEQLTPDGIIYVCVPPRLRLAAMRLLQQNRFKLETPQLHLPDWNTSRYIVPLTQQSTRYAFEKLIPTHANKRQALLLALRLPFAQGMLAHLLPSVAIVGTLGRLPFQWLFDLDREVLRTAHDVVVSASWRKQSVSIVLHCFTQDAMPVAVAKIVDVPQARPAASEADALARLAAHAHRAGAHVPEVLTVAQLGKQSVMLETVPARPPPRDSQKNRINYPRCSIAWLSGWKAGAG